jgi:hypothetical protein
MKLSQSLKLICLSCAVALAIGCSAKPKTEEPAKPATPPAPVYYKVDPATAGSITGTIHYTGKRPSPKPIDMTSDPACVEAHKGKPYDESLVVSPKGMLANAFIYIKSGLEGKTFEVPATPVTIDQAGCWFRPRVMGIQVNQVLEVINSDPVTHNIHPMAQINREWNHSMGPGDAPISRKFLKPEVMVPVKCNIHNWMHAFIGVVDNPYFSVSKDDGSFEIKNLPSGTYTLGIWQEQLGTQEQQVTISPNQSSTVSITFKGK